MAAINTVLHLDDGKAAKEIVTVKQEIDLPVKNYSEAKTKVDVNGKSKALITSSIKKPMYTEFTDNVTHGKATVTASNENETLLSDDENKILTTLEPAKKIIKIDAIPKEVKNISPNTAEEKTTLALIQNAIQDEVSERAKRQLQSLTKRVIKIKKPVPELKKTEIEVKKITTVKSTEIKDKIATLQVANETIRRNKEIPERDVSNISKTTQKVKSAALNSLITLKSQILSRDELEKEIVNNIKKKETGVIPEKTESNLLLKKMQNKLAKKMELIVERIPKSDDKNFGTIEIPQELILSTDITPSISTQMNVTKVEIQNHDLIAILEGKLEEDADQIESIKIDPESMNASQDNNDDAINIEIEIISSPKNDVEVLEEARKKEIAMRQIQNLPKKPKGRKPKNKQITEMSETNISKSDIVSALVSDWSDNESKIDDDKQFDMEEEGNYETIEVIPTIEELPIVEEVKILPTVNILNKEANKKTSPVIPFRRTRIIKKKIIWDPDAPETKKSFSPTKTISLPKDEIVRQVAQTSIRKIESSTSLPVVKTAPSLPNQAINKRKRSEIDKLLGDEGAINMIYSLQRENNNLDVPEIENKTNKKKTISLNKDNILKSKTLAIKKAVLKQSVSVAPTNASRMRVKRETTPAKSTTQSPQSASPSAVAKRIVAGKKRKVASNSNCWDYVYSSQEQADDSMIIRRRSNSSYSSTTSPRRLSVDQLSTTITDALPKTFEFIKPIDKKQVKVEPDTVKSLVADLKGKLSKAMQPKAAEPQSNSNANTRRSTRNQSVEKTETSNTNVNNNWDYEEITVELHDNFIHLILRPASDKLNNHFTANMMEEFISILEAIKKDDEYRAVLVTSSDLNIFCQGLDVTPLVQTTNEKRKNAAQELSTTLR